MLSKLRNWLFRRKCKKRRLANLRKEMDTLMYGYHVDYLVSLPYEDFKTVLEKEFETLIGGKTDERKKNYQQN